MCNNIIEGGDEIMLVNATEFKNRVGKYLEFVEKEEVIILKNGKKIARILPIKASETPNVDGLLELLKHSNRNPGNINIEQIKEERLMKYESPT